MTEKIKTFLDGLLSPTCIIDQYLVIKYANYDFLELSQITPRDIRKGISLQKCLNLDIFNDNTDIIDKALVSREKVKLREVKGHDTKGKYVSLGISIIPASLLDDSSNTIILVFTDLTSEEDVHEKYKKLYEKELEERKKIEEFNVRLNELVDEKTHELKNAYHELNKELEIARNVQEGLLPKELPNLVNMDIATEYIPTGRVGGDLYDILLTKDRNIAVLIFDVSGHGVPAALITAMAKMLFLYYIEKGGSPAEIFAEINLRLSMFVQTGHYLTAFLGFINPSNNTMVYSRAGHVEPIIYHSQTRKTSTLESGGLILGHPALQDIAKFDNDTITFDWHDKLILYTDGLTEAVNSKLEMYGKNQLIKIIQEYGHLEPKDLITEIIKDNKDFRNGNELDDDLSMVCIRIGCNEKMLKESGFAKEESPGVLTFSLHEEIEGICSIILRELDKNGYPTQHFFHSHLCIHEILANAVRHGNNYDKSKKVIVFYKINLESFSLSVIDEGEGFDYTNMPNPLLPENITKEYGRGLFLVRNYMDEISFNDKGNRILARKHLQQDV